MAKAKGVKIIIGSSFAGRILVLVLASFIGACASTPAPPTWRFLQPGQRAKGDGVVSLRGPYAVYLERVDHPGSDLQELSKFGLPVRVVFANLSSAAVPFGPGNIKVTRKGAAVAMLTTADIGRAKGEDVSRDHRNGWIALFGAVAGVAVTTMAQAEGQINAGQATAAEQVYSVNGQNQMEESDAAAHRDRSERDALVDAYNQDQIPTAQVAPHQSTHGVIFLIDVKTSDPLDIDITTGPVTHPFKFELPPTTNSHV